MAIRLVFVAGTIALAAAFAGWAFGGLTILQAILFYIGSGWIVIIGGTLAFLATGSAQQTSPAMGRRTRSIVVEVSPISGR